MTQRELEVCNTVLEFEKQGIRPSAPEICKKLGLNRIYFYKLRNDLESLGILIPHDERALDEYTVDKVKFRSAVKKIKPSVTEQAKRMGISRQTFYNRRNK